MSLNLKIAFPVAIFLKRDILNKAKYPPWWSGIVLITLPLSKGFFMFRYEVLMLTVPEITADETTALESQFEAIVKEHRATVLSFERWGKYRLAYPVNKNDYGVYFLARFEAGVQDYRALVDAIRVFLMVKNEELVMRHMIARLDENASLAYQRPESLEEVPARDSDTFFKENKMTGFMGKQGAHRASEDADKQDIDESL